MTEFVVSPSPRVALPVVGSAALFPVRRVYCVGRNYAAHAVEMGHDPDREPPFFFQKNPDDLDPSGRFAYPPMTADVHHEIELAVALRSGGRDIAARDALAHVWGYGVALDMTRRDLQGEAKKLGRPWEVGKAFEGSAPVSPLISAEAVGHPERGAVTLHVNGELRQQGDLDQMIWKTPEIIAELSRFFRLAAGDVILTGTPAGVGPVARGDVLEGAVEGVGALRVEVV
ncbi:MAG: fumarylacetoacetate hydrolase family protein [Rubrimonas sp.]|uniref:fumarylacetoacetate hydrolase family protein n=1 Tax=Rubrimonas sp. TaxID=2036015 RepID=UPI002FDEBCF7